jgi:hypothetical protein
LVASQIELMSLVASQIELMSLVASQIEPLSLVASQIALGQDSVSQTVSAMWWAETRYSQSFARLVI